MRTGSIARMAGSFDGRMALAPAPNSSDLSTTTPAGIMKFMGSRFRSRQADPHTAALLARAFIDSASRGGILDSQPATVEDHDLLRRRSPGLTARNEFSTFS